jgi:ElaB/YqjD/DUF883 family membrane-anchored ribosome-binding protein
MSNYDSKKEAVKDQVSEVSKEAKNKATDALETIKSKGEDMAETVKDKAQDVDKALTGFVRDKPYIALASALLAGWVIAKVAL